MACVTRSMVLARCSALAARRRGPSRRAAASLAERGVGHTRWRCSRTARSSSPAVTGRRSRPWRGSNRTARLDQGFGQSGFVLDRRLQILRSLAIQPDGDIVGAGVEGFQLARYLGPDGAPDPAFGGGLAAGTRDPEQPNFLLAGLRALERRPRPGRRDRGRRHPEARPVRSADRHRPPLRVRWDLPGNRRQRSPAGRVHAASNRISPPCFPQPDGSLIGAGWVHQGFRERGDSILLARFRPRLGTSYDPAFGGGAAWSP